MKKEFPTNTLSDGADFIAELYKDEAENARDGKLSAAGRRDAGQMARVFAEAFAALHRIMHPNVPGISELADTGVISISKAQLKKLLSECARAGLPDEEIVHLRVDKGYTEAIVVNPDIENGGRELFREQNVLVGTP